MKKSSSVLIGIIIVIVVVVGGYAIFHKSSKPKTTANSTASSKVAAVNNAVLTTKTDPKLGQYLADPSGKALYTYGGDTSGVSNCTGSCLATWPPYLDTGSTTGLPTGVTVVTRSDSGKAQYAYNGMPLYYFSSDSAGQVTGNGVSNFSVAVPAAAASSSSSSSSSTAPSSSSSSSSAPAASSSSSNPYNY